MDVEEREVDEERYNNQSNCSRCEVSPEVCLNKDNTRQKSNPADQQMVLAMVLLLSSRRPHKSIKTAIPIVATVRTPLTFEPHVNAMNVPVARSHSHHWVENSLFQNTRVSPGRYWGIGCLGIQTYR